MLVDDVTITIKAGDGGKGGMAFRHTAGTIKTPPDGGNGGRGGDIYFEASHDVSDLSEFRFKKKIEAEDGESGRRNNQYGKAGEDITVKVPIGTTIEDIHTGDVAELDKQGDRFLVARGGRGGLGNREVNKRGRSNPEVLRLEEGEPGEEKEIHLVLKLIAEVGLVGFPNAGKSTLINALTRSKSKIGAYPFTTLEPQLGVMDSIVLADIPGLIEGASSGKGLGIQFLKHIEKTKLLVHLIDVTSENPFDAYMLIRNEFKEYGGVLLEKPEIVVLTKTDLVNENELSEKKEQLQKTGKEITTLSVYDEKSLEKIRTLIQEKVNVLRLEEPTV